MPAAVHPPAVCAEGVLKPPPVIRVMTTTADTCVAVVTLIGIKA
jgi:hypothetical protein